MIDADLAFRVASRFHKDHMYGDRAYMDHLKDVAKVVWDCPGHALVRRRAMIRAVVFLRGVLEDAGAPVEVLLRGFSREVVEAVVLLKTPSEGLGALFERMRGLGTEKPEHVAALVVMAAERLVDIQTCLRLWDPRIENHIAQHDRFMEAVFRPRLCDKIWDQIHQEFEKYQSSL